MSEAKTNNFLNKATTLCLLLAGYIFTTTGIQNTADHKAFIERVEKLEAKSAAHDIALAVIQSRDANNEEGP
jgi:hypothetical protein